MQDASMLAWALEYKKRGWNIIPLFEVDGQQCSCPAGAKCTSAGKHPRIRWVDYQTKEITEDQVRAWWARWPKANIGLITGAISGVIVLDVDVPHGEKTLRDGGYSLPPTPTVRTGSGGLHYYFRHPGFECRNFAGKSGKTILPNVDFRGDGGLIVLPPSRNLKGAYEWLL
jgi:hypothetical protein